MLAALGDAAVASAFLTPAVWGVKGEEARVEFFERLVAGRAAGFRGQEGELLVGGEKLDEALTDGEGLLDVGAEFGNLSLAVRNLGHDDVDVMFLETFEAGEGGGLLELPVD